MRVRNKVCKQPDCGTCSLWFPLSLQRYKWKFHTEEIRLWMIIMSILNSSTLFQSYLCFLNKGKALILSKFSTQDLFVLLDLLGGADPIIVNHFDNTARWFDRLIAAGEHHL